VPLLDHHLIKKHIDHPVLGSDTALRVLSFLLGWRSVNKRYEELRHLSASEFCHQWLLRGNTHVHFDDRELEKIPDSGGLLVICNHPTGAPDGLAMIDILLRRRTDLRVMGNDILSRIEPIREFIIPIDPFSSNGNARSNILGLKKAVEWLRDGHVVLLFPSGEVAHRKGENGKYEESEWHPVTGKLLQQHTGKILPVFIEGHNRQLFYLLGKVHPVLRSALIPLESIQGQRSDLTIRMGKALKPPKEVEPLREVRMHLSALALELELEPEPHRQIIRVQEPVIREVDRELVHKELTALNDTGDCLLHTGPYRVYLMKKKDAPETIREIGRLREVNFRMEGEGTGLAIDLDPYDDHFTHLVLYHEDHRCIAGAYRLGIAADCLARPGYSGFYNDQFFAFSEQGMPFFSQCIEMGRAFIEHRYKDKGLPLLLLWKGIVLTTERHPEIRYLFGTVSMSAAYTVLSQRLLTAFLLRYFHDEKMAELFQPKDPYLVSPGAAEIRIVEALGADGFNRLNQLVQSIEPDGKGLPHLYKRYIEQNARVLHATIDTSFGNCLDLLMVLDLQQMANNPILDTIHKHH